MRIAAQPKAYLFFLILTVGVCFTLSSCNEDKDTEQTTSESEVGGSPLKIISLSGVITEVLFELGQGNNIVGIDITSTYPAENLVGKAQLGHTSKLNAEAILALSPDIIFCLETDAEKPVLKQLAESGLKVIPLSTSTYFDNSVQLAQQLAQHVILDTEVRDRLVAKVEADSLALNRFLAEVDDAPKVLFIYARGTARLFVGGADTPVAAMINKAGGMNAIEDMVGYKELTSEALLSANPDVVLMFSSGLSSLDGVEGLTQISGMSQTKAYQNQRILAMDGHYLSSFGPRAGQAGLELAKGIHQKGK